VHRIETKNAKDRMPPPEPTLENFVPGANAELLARLREAASGALRESVLYLWGEPGCGRSHLLQATLRVAMRDGLAVRDDVDRLDEAAQITLFNLINQARESGGCVLAAGPCPPAQLALRADLRSRLGWGLIYQVQPLSDAQKAVGLRAEAERRGLRITDEVLWYLLNHVRRDLPSLFAILDELDRKSLERQRPITLPLVRESLRGLEL
jgi:DnaA family protein